MPRRDDIRTILVIGAGPIVIGQACEFDYSGTQAIKALREEGYRVILVNSNPATIMTDPGLADVTYIEPILPEYIAKIIAKERPDAILPTVGGQTALNCTVALHQMGVLERYQVALIGASIEAIEMAENRQLFKEAMARIGLECPRNVVVQTLEAGIQALETIGLPAIIRPSFTLGGHGSGIAHTLEEFKQIVAAGLSASPTHEVLIDESIVGWKEYEMEVIRDTQDNAIIVCSIENIDPMGVHTGDSITVAPALTLTDKEFQRMRDASIAVLREIGVDTGGSNVQFAVHPETGRMLVIEMNPRVSRSSALASKATGFPIAKVAAKLAVGYALNEIMNDCTQVTPASFEPVLDYVVVKIPRFTFEKFAHAQTELSSAMKSVGEAMAIGRNFLEALQKAYRSLEIGLNGVESLSSFPHDVDTIKRQLARQLPERFLLVAHALRLGLTVEEIHTITHYDPWFLRQLASLVAMEKQVQMKGLPSDMEGMYRLKSAGFSDVRLAQLISTNTEEVTALRHALGVRPCFKMIDTCAAEFTSNTPYFYSTYERSPAYLATALPSCESVPSTREKVVVLGSGPNRIGQGIEFDYACVHAAYALKEAGFEAIMINCNPETVSTDYDTSDRLYFEPLLAEEVLEILHREQQVGTLKGVIVQFGGQTPLKLAHILEKAGIPILGTAPDAIDLAEDRERFKQLLHHVKLHQPENFTCYSADEVAKRAIDIGYPVVVRPSYVLGGRAMAVIHHAEELHDYLAQSGVCFDSGPLLVDSYLQEAVEVDVDALCDGEHVYVAGIMEHIEEAGIHSGDSSCVLPPHTLSASMQAQLTEQTIAMAKALKVVGLMNVQFAIKDEQIYVLEVNPRASRTIPFVAKATGIPVAKIATRLMVGDRLCQLGLTETQFATPAHIAVKVAVFPFARFSDTDVILGPEMKSTGEVMGVDNTFAAAYAKGQMGAGNSVPSHGVVFISIKDADKSQALTVAGALIELGFTVVATRGTARYFEMEGLEVQGVNKVYEGHPHIVHLLEAGSIDLVINTTAGKESIADSFSIRRTALLRKIPYAITMSGARAMVQAIRCMKMNEMLAVASLQSMNTSEQ
jgi:carbamoyl-phosphate synthase large subunit